MPPPSQGPQNVPITPTTPVVGTTPEALTTQQQWQQHKLFQLLQKQQEEMQKSKMPFKRIYGPSLQKGALVTFQYLAWKHDPWPLILISSIYGPPKPGLVAGVNLHYLTFRFIKQMIKLYCDKQFYYTQIKTNQFIYNAFRTYKKTGMRQLQRLDCNYLSTILGAVRSYNPNEIEAIRKYVQEQLRRMTNPTAEDLANQYANMILNDPLGQKYDKFRDQIGELYKKLPSPPNPNVPYGKVTRGDKRFNPGPRSGGPLQP